MDVLVKGDTVVFRVPGSKFLSAEEDWGCYQSLPYQMRVNGTESVQLNPSGLWIKPASTMKDKVFPSPAEPLYISTPILKPTPLPLSTYDPVISQSPGLAFINEQTMREVAETVLAP